MAREEGGTKGGEEVVVAGEAMERDVEVRHCPLRTGGRGGGGGLSRLGNMDTNTLIGSFFRRGGTGWSGLVDRSSGSCSSLPDASIFSLCLTILY